MLLTARTYGSSRDLAQASIAMLDRWLGGLGVQESPVPGRYRDWYPSPAQVGYAPHLRDEVLVLALRENVRPSVSLADCHASTRSAHSGL
jgi:hypothetical protein